MTHEGNMNPMMSAVDIVPDDDLNTRLKFYVSTKLTGNSWSLMTLVLTVGAVRDELYGMS